MDKVNKSTQNANIAIPRSVASESASGPEIATQSTGNEHENANENISSIPLAQGSTTQLPADDPSSGSDSSTSGTGPSALLDSEQELIKRYGRGRVPPPHKHLLEKIQEKRKFFDSGDYAMSQAGFSSIKSVGSGHPSPDTIPHHFNAPRSSPTNESPLASENSSQG